MLTFEKVLEIFADYLTADETIEVYISRHGCVRVEFDQDFHYCSGEVCHTPKELFDLLAEGYRTVRDQIHRLNLSCKMNRITIQFHLGLPGQYLVQHCGTACRSKLCINIDSGLLFA